MAQPIEIEEQPIEIEEAVIEIKQTPQLSDQQTDSLFKLQEYLGIEDIERCYNILELYHWNLEVATRVLVELADKPPPRPTNPFLVSKDTPPIPLPKYLFRGDPSSDVSSLIQRGPSPIHGKSSDERQAPEKDKSNANIEKPTPPPQSCVKMSRNPVEEHLMALRLFSFDLEDSMVNAEELLAMFRNQIVHLRLFLQELPDFFIPKFPPNYPFTDVVQPSFSRRQKIKIKVVGCPKEDEVEKQTRKFVYDVLLETGFYVKDLDNCECEDICLCDAQVLEHLVDAADRFLTKLVRGLRKNQDSRVLSDRAKAYYFKNKTNEPYLMNALENTLRQLKFEGGIQDLHKFYYENIVKMHDKVLIECAERLQEYEDLRREVLALRHAHEAYLIDCLQELQT